VSCT